MDDEPDADDKPGKTHIVRGQTTVRTTRRLAILISSFTAIAVIASGCSGPGPDQASNDTYSAEVGCHPQMDDAFRAWEARGVGASVVVLGGERECVAAYGLADQETGRPNTTDTIFSIGSITKPITSAAIFDLIDTGVLTLDDTAGQHVEGLGGLAGQSTIRNLLLHTTGLQGEPGFDHVPLSKAEAIEALSTLDQRFGAASEPGTQFRYENTNYSVLALIIDSVTTQGYRRYIAEEILLDRNGEPLGGGWWDGTPAPDGPRAWGYTGDQPAVERGDAPGPHWAMNGNGAMALTPLQLAEWTYAFFNEKILSPEATRNYISTSTLLGGVKEISGWGEFDKTLLGEPFFSSSGGGSGIGHLMDVLWFPESSRVLVIARNTDQYDARDFNESVLPALGAGTGVPGPPTIPSVDRETLDAFVGSYLVGTNGRLTVEEEDGGLLVTAVGVEAAAALRPVLDDERRLANEQIAAAIIDGEHTADSARFFEHYQTQFGDLLGAEVEGTYSDGLPWTIVNLRFDGIVIPAEIATDLAGNTVFAAHPKPIVGPAEVGLFYVFDEDEDGFVERYPAEGNARMVLRMSGPDIEIDGPAGTTIATRSN